jgi:predicted aspartyl protease
LIRDPTSECLGLTLANLRISGSEASEEMELAVDTGSIYTWVAEGKLGAIGARALGKRNFRTVEGREIVRMIGEAMLEFEGDKATRIVVFAEPGDGEVLGVDSLEGLGLEVDPTTRRLNKVEAFIAY